MKNKNIDILCHLLCVAIGTEQAELCNLEDLSWQSVYALARKQGVLAVAFDGLTKLFEHDEAFAKSFPQPLKLQWINAVFNIEQRYERQRAVCAELAEKWAEQGIKTLCLKGMAFSTFYPVSEHRECGDFDCYLYDDYAKGNAIARELGAMVDDGWYKHSEIVYRKVMIENHQYIVAVRGGKRMKQLHTLLDDIARNEERKAIFDTRIEMPSPMFNALFMNHHSLTHFLSEGIRLRHILDWALFLRTEQHNLDWERFYAHCEEYNMRAFVDCATALAVKVFGVKVENEQIIAESQYAERVLSSILHDDTAVFSQGVGKWRTRVLLLRNLFAARWKYKAFSTHNIFSKLVSLAWGFITHPEEE